MKKIKKLFKGMIKVIIGATIIGGMTVAFMNHHVVKQGEKYIVDIKDAPEVDALLVLGARVYSNGNVSPILKDRLDVALQVYDQQKANKFLLSGDHGQTSYDEVNGMKNYILSKGIEEQNIFMDHAGFSTYESIYRARDIFQVKKVIIVTQEYHLKRAVYIARKMGLDAYGVASDLQPYLHMRHYETREVAARCKDFLFVNIFKPQPKYLGEVIEISGDGRVTNDKE